MTQKKATVFSEIFPKLVDIKLKIYCRVIFEDLFSIKKYWRELEMTYIHISNKITEKFFCELNQFKAIASFRYIIIILNWLLDHVNSVNTINIYHFKIIIWIIDPFQGFLKPTFEKYMDLRWITLYSSHLFNETIYSQNLEILISWCILYSIAMIYLLLIQMYSNRIVIRASFLWKHLHHILLRGHKWKQIIFFDSRIS